MNLSGQAVREAAGFYKIPPEAVVVFHDELDILPGRVKVKQGGGSAGHNGLKSLDQHLGNPYYRVRLGIGHPGRPELVSGYVLSDVPKAEQDDMNAVIHACAEALPALLTGDMAAFTNQVAQRLAPPKSNATKESDRHGL
jgi:PTH1 family peptidyl-tRNA hydrolase